MLSSDKAVPSMVSVADFAPTLSWLAQVFGGQWVSNEIVHAYDSGIALMYDMEASWGRGVAFDGVKAGHDILPASA